MNSQSKFGYCINHPNFKYCTLFVSGTELRTNGQTDGQTDDQITRCPRRAFQAGGIKRRYFVCETTTDFMLRVSKIKSCSPFIPKCLMLIHFVLNLHK